MAEWDLEAAHAHYASGASLRAVGEHFGGVSAQTVHKRFRRAGLSTRPRRWTSAEEAVLRDAYHAATDNGPLDLVSVAAALGRDKANVCRKAKTLGLPTSRSRPPTEPRRQQMSANMELRRMMDPTVQRPAQGMRHTDASKQKMSAAQRARAAAGGTVVRRTQKQRQAASQNARKALSASNPYSRTKSGRRPDLGDTFFRSAWEANYARYLNYRKASGEIADWAFEPDTFWFEKVRRGVRSYLPDFRITRPDGSRYYVEVKGWMDAKSKTKLKRMAKYHPEVELQVVGAREYRDLRRSLAHLIRGWED